MAKTNNLTDFLTGLADKFRAKLGGTALINPQSFESKIDEVYQKGYDSAPQGVDTSDATAAADDVQNGKTFYAGGVKKTGSLNVTAGLIDSAVTVVDEPGNNQIYAQNAGISQKAIYNKNTKTKLLIPYEKTISAIGLTADKIVSGNTILGVNGTAVTGVDVSDTTATPFDVLAGKYFYLANGTKEEGMINAHDSWINPAGSVADVPNRKLLKANSIPEGGRVMLDTGAVYTLNVPYSAVANAIGLTGDKIVSGNTILGVAGTAQTGVDTSDATATAADILSGKTAYVNGVKLTGTAATGGGSETGFFNVQQGAYALQDIVITISNPMQIMPKRLLLMMITDGQYYTEEPTLDKFVAGLVDFEANAAILFGLGSFLNVFTTTASDFATVSGNTITFSDPTNGNLCFLADNDKTYFYSVEY